ncbi:hypothetical protein GCM10007901_40660 [Dyella acidisoli]|uniref:Uncharacterized protein n=1 Tax=Dyella acidisoli TaxID=1867834 RepID=A0ABQ5XTA4_9GAMM|nr:hypothetical protein GCM10007901_40660 [Dyella acidisoli]
MIRARSLDVCITPGWTNSAVIVVAGVNSEVAAETSLAPPPQAASETMSSIHRDEKNVFIGE